MRTRCQVESSSLGLGDGIKEEEWGVAVLALASEFCLI